MSAPLTLASLDPSFSIRPVTVWSCGGGRQSVAIAGLIALGILPKPDYSVIVNVGYEKSTTWQYADAVLIPELAKVGVTLEIVHKSDYATVDLWGGKDGKTLLLPCFTNKSGSVGKMTNFCSGEWKKRTIERHMKRVHGVKAWTTWLGMSTDEMRRVRVKDEETGNRNEYPLCFGPRPLSKAGCVEFVTKELGWPEPPQSTCRHCPNQSDLQWWNMKRYQPDDWAEAVMLDHAIREIDPHAYLHRLCIPLDEIDFEALYALPVDPATKAKEGCDSGYCFS